MHIQCVYDLLSENFVSFTVDPYSKNDLMAAPELVLQEGDLVFRDRGYLILDEVQRHIDNGAIASTATSSIWCCWIQKQKNR
jgi:Transposase DDE domain